MFYRAKIIETRVTEIDFTPEEIENGDDPEIAAFEIAHSIPINDWEIEDTWIEVEEMEGEL